jgi:hypothetical protein
LGDTGGCVQDFFVRAFMARPSGWASPNFEVFDFSNGTRLLQSKTSTLLFTHFCGTGLAEFSHHGSPRR